VLIEAAAAWTIPEKDGAVATIDGDPDLARGATGTSIPNNCSPTKKIVQVEAPLQV